MENIRDIAAAIDFARVGTPLAHFYEDRAEIRQVPGSRESLFEEIHDEDGPRSGYAYHWGGRRELQLNIGFEKERTHFRYGAAFSIERGPYYENPVEVLTPIIHRFNAILSQYPALAGLEMWYVDKRVPEARQRVPVGPVRTISDAQIHEGVFIFFGEGVPVGVDGIGPEVISRAVTVLNLIYPLYLALLDETGAEARALEYRVARICWNTHMWTRPSGPLGKARSKDTFERKHGFGHEEWIGDLSTLVCGYKHAFIQPMNANHDAYASKRLALLLYAIDGTTGQRYWAGAIDSVQTMTEREAVRVAREFKREGWLRMMEQQVEALGLDKAAVTDTGRTELFNVRFRPDALRMFDPPIPFPAEDVPADYYGILQLVPPAWEHLTDVDANTDAYSEPGEPDESDEESDDTDGATTATRAPSGGGDVKLIQTQWQNALMRTLRVDLPAEVKPRREFRLGRNRVDIRLKASDRTVFIELKPRGTPTEVIREAFGQLMEYAYWPTTTRCDTLLIVGPGVASARDRAYLATMRERFGIPVHYLHYREGRIIGIGDWYRALPTVVG